MATVIGSAIVDVTPSVEGFAGKLQGLLSNIPIAGAIAGVAIGIGVGLLKIGEDFEHLNDTIIQKTGASGTALKGLEQSAKDVFSTAIGANFQNVGDAISEISVRTGLTGKALDALATKEIELGTITKTNVGQNVQDTTAIFTQFGVAADQQSSKLDVLFKASQLSGVGISAFDTQMKAAAPTAQMLGLNVDQTAAFVAKIAPTGINAQRVLASLGTEFAKAAKAGQDPTTVINNMVSALQKAPNATAAAELAVTKYGVSGSQAAKLVDLVRAGAFNFGQTLASITNGQGGILSTATATETLGQKFGVLKNRLLTDLQPVASKVLDFVTDIVDDIGPAISGLAAIIGPIFRTISGYISDFMDGFKTGDSASSLGLSGFVGTLVNLGNTAARIFAEVKSAWHLFMDGFKSGSSGLTGVAGDIEKFGAVAKQVFTWVRDNIKPILIGLGIAFVVLTSPVLAVVGALTFLYIKFQTFREVVNTVAALLISVLGGAFKAIVDIVKEQIAVFQDLIHFVEDIFEGHWRAAFDALIDIPRRVFDLVIKLFKDFGPSILLALKDIGSLAAKGLELLGSFLLGLIEKLPEVLLWLALLPIKILLAVGDFAGRWIAKGLELLGGLLLGLIQKLPSVIEWLAELPLKLLAFGAAFAVLLVVKGVELLTGLLTGLINKLPDILNWFVQLPGRILNGLVVIGTLVVRGIEILAGFIVGLVQKIPDLLAWFVALPGKILNWLGDVGSWLVQKGIDLIAGLWNGIKSLWPAVIGWFEGLPGAVARTVAGIGTWLLQAGKDLIQGFVNGIESLPGLVTGAITKIVTGPIHTAESILHIHSPSGVFAEIGQNVVLGFAQGLNQTGPVASSFANLMAVTKNFTPTAPNPFSGGSSLPLPGSYAGAAPQVNLTLQMGGVHFHGQQPSPADAAAAGAAAASGAVDTVVAKRALLMSAITAAG